MYMLVPVALNAAKGQSLKGKPHTGAVIGRMAVPIESPFMIQNKF